MLPNLLYRIQYMENNEQILSSVNFVFLVMRFCDTFCIFQQIVMNLRVIWPKRLIFWVVAVARVSNILYFKPYMRFK
ncbi:MAG: hypothetical protein ACI96N_002216 [Arenicella sp.]|jgi:hypothetical protein